MSLVSVVITAYNVEKFIHATLQSVCKQSLTDIEIIVVNDGSTDNTLAIVTGLQQADSRIVLLSDSNQGVVLARAKGQQAAQSPYIYHVDGDDLLEPTALEQLYQKAIETDADIVCFDYRLYHTESKSYSEVKSLHWNTLSPVEWLNQSFLGHIPWALWTHLHKNSLYQEVDYRWQIGLHMGEDAVLSTQLALAAKKLAKVNQTLITYLQHPSSLTKKPFPDKVYYSYIFYPERMISLCQRNKLYPQLSKGLHNLYVRAAEETLYKKKYSKAHYLCKKAQQALKKYPELAQGKDRRILKLIRLYARAQWLGNYYMRECIRKNKL